MTGFDDALIWVMAASAVIWLGIGGYMAFLAMRQAALARRCKQLELWRDEHTS